MIFSVITLILTYFSAAKHENCSKNVVILQIFIFFSTKKAYAFDCEIYPPQLFEFFHHLPIILMFLEEQK